jgi:hypothetical protein
VVTRARDQCQAPAIPFDETGAAVDYYGTQNDHTDSSKRRHRGGDGPRASGRWADEERKQTARGYTLLHLGLRYRRRISDQLTGDAFVTIENVANVEWREAQVFNTSRLRGEPAEGVPDIVYTPGNPCTVMGGVALCF